MIFGLSKFSQKKKSAKNGLNRRLLSKVLQRRQRQEVDGAGLEGLVNEKEGMVKREEAMAKLEVQLAAAGEELHGPCQIRTRKDLKWHAFAGVVA